MLFPVHWPQDGRRTSKIHASRNGQSPRRRQKNPVAWLNSIYRERVSPGIVTSSGHVWPTLSKCHFSRTDPFHNGTPAMCSHFDAASPSSSHNVGAAFRKSIRKEIQGCVRSNVRIFVHPHYTRKSRVGNGQINIPSAVCPQKCPPACPPICPSPCLRVSCSARLFQPIPRLQDEAAGAVFAEFGGLLFLEHAEVSPGKSGP